MQLFTPSIQVDAALLQGKGASIKIFLMHGAAGNSYVIFMEPVA